MDRINVMKDKTAYLSKDEVDAMLDWCYNNDRVRDYVLILTLIRTARRVTEIVGRKPYKYHKGLRPCDIQPNNLIEWDILKKNHVFRKTKTGQERSPEIVKRMLRDKQPTRKLKPVDDEYYSILKEYIESQGITPYERVFPLTRQHVDKIIKRAAKACNITRPHSKIHAHNFRHSYAIWMLKNNPNDASTLRHVQELLDHENIEMTMTYAQFTQADKLNSLNRLFVS